MNRACRIPFLAGLLAVVALLLAPAWQPAFAQDDREYQRLTREIQTGINNARVTDEHLAGLIGRLENWPNATTMRFLIRTVLRDIANARRVDRSGLEPAVVAVMRQIAAADEEAAGVLVESMYDEALPEALRFRLVEAQLAGGEASDTFLQRGLMGNNWATRVLLLNFLARQGTINDETFQAVRDCLFHADRRVRHAAMLAVERLCVQAAARSPREVACFEALIELLTREQSGLKRDVMRVLQNLSRQQLGEEPAPWRAWLEAYRNGTAPPVDDRPAATGAVRDYYDIEMPKKMIFVVDFSVSMNEELANKEAVRQRLERNQPRGYDWNRVNTMLDLARAEFIRAIESLREPQHRRDGREGRSTDGNEPVGDGDEAFTVISYASNAQAWRNELAVASVQNKRDVIQWANRSHPGGLTNMYEALDLAFRIAGEVRPENRGVTSGGEAQRPRDAVEAIFFMTDGFATVGKYHHNSVNQTFQRLDANRDDRLSWEEYLSAFDLEFITEEAIRPYFTRDLDRNGDGYISRDELQARQADFYAAQMDNLIGEFTRRNEMLHLKIHTIGIGRHDRRGLAALAQRNNGTYVDLGP